MRSIHIFSDRKSRIRFVCGLVVFLFTITGVGVLNRLNVIGDSWSTILNTTFTGLGCIVAFLQWHEQTTSEVSCTAEVFSPEKAVPHEPSISGLANKRKGAIVVYAPRTWRGTTLHLLSGLQE